MLEAFCQLHLAGPVEITLSDWKQETGEIRQIADAFEGRDGQKGLCQAIECRYGSSGNCTRKVIVGSDIGSDPDDTRLIFVSLSRSVPRSYR